MAEIQGPAYLDEGCVTAQGDRQVLNSIVCGEGVTPGLGGELAVTERGAGANMSVDVAAGNAFIAGTQASWQGMYHASNDAVKNLTIAAADPTDDRIDIVVATVRDSIYSGLDDDWILQVVTGTASPVPTPPATPDNSLVLAEVLVAAGATSIVDADITDTREYYTLCTGSGVLLDTIVYTAGDTFDKADYPTLAYVDVEVQGSGGAGGGAAASHPKFGAGGGSGGYCRGIIPEASLGASETVTVGAAGAGASGATGGNGATSSFGTHIVCAGGQGGEAGGIATFPEGGDSGNVPTAPADAVEIEGQDGQYGWGVDQGSGDYTATSGSGANSHLGLGGVGRTRPDNPVGASTVGRAATGYGAGGGGAINTLAAGGGAAAGGAGSPGIVIVHVYA